MPNAQQQARKVLSEAELNYNTIQYCPCDQFLYYEPDKDILLHCTQCGLYQYRTDTQAKNIPRKKLHYFFIIPCLLAQYRSPISSKLMRVHHENRNPDDIMRGLANAKAW